ncbi:flagellar biosynthesis protein FlgA [Schaalia sp. 19OD2882]|uniref:SAF domain-containing protein n=1 Tax=Schaalia sp. 19OD2882 TaxID=2794089 RepID=UPI001C1EC5A2|nr:SAF domain-containing protein [Schaalia sp. 19OD2882]QWW20314.1 flagellar biosynthesis protein FlgA [Schaalia sp. 19OD2882]
MTTKATKIRVTRDRPVWKDPRFIGGLLLVILAVVGTTWIVSVARNGTPMLQATRAISPGEVLDSSNTTVVEVRTESDVYVKDGELPEDAVATRTIDKGELLTFSAARAGSDLKLRRIVLTVAQALPESVQAGDELELWAVPDDSLAGKDKVEPRQLGSRATLVQVLEANTADRGRRIEVVLHAEDLPEVLSATTRRTTLTAVPVGR